MSHVCMSHEPQALYPDKYGYNLMFETLVSTQLFYSECEHWTKKRAGCFCCYVQTTSPNGENRGHGLCFVWTVKDGIAVRVSKGVCALAQLCQLWRLGPCAECRPGVSRFSWSWVGEPAVHEVFRTVLAFQVFQPPMEWRNRFKSCFETLQVFAKCLWVLFCSEKWCDTLHETKHLEFCMRCNEDHRLVIFFKYDILVRRMHS